MGRSVPSANCMSISDEKISGWRSAQATSSCREMMGWSNSFERATGHSASSSR